MTARIDGCLQVDSPNQSPQQTAADTSPAQPARTAVGTVWRDVVH
jgi:hypothetical protein